MNTSTCIFDNENLLGAPIISNNLICPQDEYKNRLHAPSYYSNYSKIIQYFPLVRTDRLIQLAPLQSTDTNRFVRIIYPYFMEPEKLLETVFVNIDQLSKRTATILGKNGVERFETFKKYSKEWEGGYSLPLSNGSIAVMEYFINQFSDFQGEPSLFLTPNGNLQLGWENTYGQVIELEFYPDKIEYYIEALEIEGKVNLDKNSIDWLISTLCENN